MAGQSLMMGDAFGKGFQYGKRKISSMSNEEFNALTPDDLARAIVTDYTAIIQQMKPAFEDSRAFQSLILQELGEIIKTIPSEIRKFFGIEDIDGTTPTIPKEPDPFLVIPPDAYNWDTTIASLLSGAGIAGTNFNLLKAKLEEFFKPIFDFGQQFIDQAQEVVSRFLEDLEDKPPLEEEEVPPDIEPPDIQPIDNIVAVKLYEELINSLIRTDFKIGGHRHRNYKGTLMHWEVPFFVLWSQTGGKLFLMTWSGTEWTQTPKGTSKTYTEAIALANTLKSSQNAQLAVEFIVGSVREIYIVKTFELGH